MTGPLESTGEGDGGSTTRVAVVLAGTQGLGLACGEALVASGHAVVTCGRDAGRLESAVARLRSGGGEATGIVADVSDASAAEEVVRHAVDLHGRLDVLVTSSGGPRTGEFADLSLEDWEVGFHLVLRSAVAAIGAAVPVMVARGRGRVVVVGSSSARSPLRGLTLSNVFRPALDGLVKSLAAHADYVLLGGGMACTFMAANGLEVGASLVDASANNQCKTILSDYAAKVVLPLDSRVLMPDESVEIVKGSVPHVSRILDIGPETCDLFGQRMRDAETVFWNGPMGMFEDERFSLGTRSVAQSMAQCEGFTVVGGGDSVAALDSAGLSGNVGFLSTGGGAALELLEKGDLPGLAALRKSMDEHAPSRSAPWEEEWGLA